MFRPCYVKIEVKNEYRDPENLPNPNVKRRNFFFEIYPRSISCSAPVLEKI